MLSFVCFLVMTSFTLVPVHGSGPLSLSGSWIPAEGAFANVPQGWLFWSPAVKVVVDPNSTAILVADAQGTFSLKGSLDNLGAVRLNGDSSIPYPVACSGQFLPLKATPSMVILCQLILGPGEPTIFQALYVCSGGPCQPSYAGAAV